MNLSKFTDEETATTDPEAAAQRAENLAVLGVRTVLELCVGPSLMTLEHAYSRYGIRVVGNDIDPRWAESYPDGSWMRGDALDVDWHPFDAVVFAPPLSHGCSGKREDALRINEVFPRYQDFLDRPFHGLKVMVLPARAMATRYDRQEMYDLIGGRSVEIVPLTSGRRQIRKYVDVYLVGAPTSGQASQVGNFDRS